MKTQLTDVRGIGPSTARALEAVGIRNVAALAGASPGQVATAQGFGESRAADVIAAAKDLLAATDSPKAPARKTAPSEEASKPQAKKAKAKKSDKKQAKGKKSAKKKKKGKKKGKKK